uniref:Uncharacterized protein n=1 Tax=Glossina palpalis gambiensis TaxID=67801 RepID=A0A1B0B8C2_9MUSC
MELPLCCTSRPFTIFSMLFNSVGELVRFSRDGGVVGDIEIGRVFGVVFAFNLVGLSTPKQCAKLTLFGICEYNSPVSRDMEKARGNLGL